MDADTSLCQLMRTFAEICVSMRYYIKFILRRGIRMMVIGALTALKYVACGMLIANGVKRMLKEGRRK